MYRVICTLFCLIILMSTSIAEETFLSLKKNKVNVRYGPSFDLQI
jgi:SH3-like domain-containing protein